MKPIFFLLLFSYFFQTNAQSEVMHITSYDKAFQAEISTYPIQIYLKYHKNAEFHENVYSVKGWYYYLSKKTPIELVGYYASGNLYLYQIENKSWKQKILDLDFSINDVGVLKIPNDSKKGFSEYFFFDWLNENTHWENADKSLPVTTSTSDFDIRKTASFLKIERTNQDSYFIDLNALELHASTLKFIAQKETTSQFRVILQYDFVSNPNPNGMCGGGKEKGFYQLNYDKNLELQDIQTYSIESCYDNIYTEKVDRQADGNTEYEVDNDGQEQIIIVNEEMAEITQIEPF